MLSPRTSLTILLTAAFSSWDRRTTPLLMSAMLLVIVGMSATSPQATNAYVAGFAIQDEQTQSSETKLEKADLGSTRRAFRFGDVFMGGQFSEEDIEQLKKQGVKRVVNLRGPSELDWDEKKAVEEAGIEYIALPIASGEDLTDELLEKVRELLKDDKSTLLHCGSANRAAGVWVPFRVLDEGASLESALNDASEVGLRNETLEKFIVDYIKARQEGQSKEESVRPGINKNFLDPDLDVDRYVGQFEIESREVFGAREAVLKASGIKAGDRVADVGAGTGIYTRLFSRHVGPSGWVYAVDIAPPFIEHINETSKQLQLENITGVICSENSINLPPDSVDAIFVCDTYHHFEYPKSTVSSMMRALKPGGTLIVIDFDREEGKSSDWIMSHVRAGKEVFKSEIEQVGFEFVEEVEIDGFKENYFLKFKRPE